MVGKRETTINVAFTVLREAAKTYDPNCQTEAVRLALRVLLPVVDHHTLTAFWRVTTNPNPAQRRRTLMKMIAIMEGAASINIARP